MMSNKRPVKSMSLPISYIPVDVDPARRAMLDETTPLNKTKHRNFVITTYSVPEKAASSRTKEKPTMVKKLSNKRLSGEFGVQAKRELALVDSLRIQQPVREQVHALLNDAFMRGHLTCVLLAFCISEEEFQQVAEPEKWEQSTEQRRLYDEREISENQLALDVRRFEQHHLLIASVMLYLKREMTSHMHLIISRRRVALRQEPNPQHSSFWKRHWAYERDARYYKILVDFAQSEPMHELKHC